MILMRDDDKVRGRAAAILLFSWLGLWWVSQSPASAQSPASTVVVLRMEGVVDPFIASYVEDGISEANASGAAAVLITIDTPGGLDSSMRAIIKAILNSKVPVICYTSPSGARAASAGAFVMISCPVAAMAPGTNIGAAHPVGVSGAIEQTKVTNDAAAFIRSLAERWDRNADWAEQAVRDSVAVAAEEAGRLHVIDLIAPNTSSLLERVGACSGSVRPPPATGLLRTQGSIPAVCGATLVELKLGLGAGILHRLIDPSLSFLFFYGGLVLIIIELLHPGVSVPGILGVLMLSTAFLSFGLLPVELGGIVLLIASALFFLLELKHPGVGAPTVAGVISLVLGGTLLFNPAVPNARVSIWLLVFVALGLAAFFAVVVRAVLEAKTLPAPKGGLEDLVGQEGVALTELNPEGHIRALGEDWTAESTGPRIAPGEPVRIVRVEGLRLFVEAASGREVNPAGRRLAGKGGRK